MTLVESRSPRWAAQIASLLFLLLLLLAAVAVSGCNPRSSGNAGPSVVDSGARETASDRPPETAIPDAADATTSDGGATPDLAPGDAADAPPDAPADAPADAAADTPATDTADAADAAGASDAPTPDAPAADAPGTDAFPAADARDAILPDLPVLDVRDALIDTGAADVRDGAPG
jgi:hypothetical protein